MAGTKKDIEEWPFLRWNTSRNRWMVDARTKSGGQRKFFSSKEEAQDWRQAQLALRGNQGSESFDETDLKEFGLTVADAIKFTVEHYRRERASRTVEDAITELVKKSSSKHVMLSACPVWFLGCSVGSGMPS